MSAVPAPVSHASPWRSALAVFVPLLAAIGWFYRDTALAMADVWWRSETFAHCLLVPPIVLWLVWRQRAVLAALAPRPQPWLLLPMLAVAAFWLLSELVAVNAATQFAFVATLVLAVPAVFGWPVARTIFFPLMFAFFAVPFGEFALPWMMEWTADFVVGALQMTGVPVYREGQNFVVPSGTWSVIDECSGIRYLMASFMVGSLFAYLSYSSWRRRAAFMAVSIAVPIVANWLRAYLIVMLAHLSGNKLAVGVDHILYGWVFFGVIILAMFFIGSRWSQAPAPARVPAADEALAAAPPARRVALAAVAVAVVALLPHGVLAMLERAEGDAPAARLALPETLGAWHAAGTDVPDWSPDYDDASARARRAYAGPAGRVGVLLDYYRGEDDSLKVVSTHRLLVGMRDPAWSVPQHETRSVELDGRRVALRRSEIHARVSLSGSAERRLVVWRLYWIDGRFIGGDVEAKIAGALARLAGHGNEGATLLLYADVDDADAAIEAFLREQHGALGSLLQRTHDSR
ncbi:exosortase A [Rubrivivax gelatinosus]|uniref:Eight transmembrane protein EpsH n=1 Tax=Rubrivivax gelatinosus (strain NBRC 100245 / IL144) TaxID=983917 RepID=I0HL75_RUBGI|nr:exosortase A [Rubrivivax gelatinosus]BAL93762.1 eight transmembrane protein EpsH [Rubrivivax gelatinosus IL144]